MILSTNEATLPLWASIPFVIMLLMIAIGPLVMEHWWEKNKNKLIVSCILGIPTAVFLIMKGFTAELEHQIFGDYIPFIILLTSLFVITGGIHLSGDIQAKPIINTLFIGIGYILASFTGTTGAAMLLIRPVIETNSQRKFKTHTILFFIAAVANCGGLLSPLGDPPLLLLYLRGAEFTWFTSMLPEWLVAGVLLLTIYYFVDSYYYKKEDKKALELDASNIKPLKITGLINIIYLLGVVFAVAFINPKIIPDMVDNPETGYTAPIWLKFFREIILLTLIFMSLYTTKKKVREDNKFSWTPIIEVGVLFLGIFVTMTPTLNYLSHHAQSFGLEKPWQFFYITGLLSSFLDNAPTAVAFHSVASQLTPIAGEAVVAGVSEILLKAISIGAVFFGSMTYIGNGPNFMVKAIAEENGIKMPSFFGYILKFSLVVLLPIYIIIQLIFFL